MEIVPISSMIKILFVAIEIFRFWSLISLLLTTRKSIMIQMCHRELWQPICIDNWICGACREKT